MQQFTTKLKLLLLPFRFQFDIAILYTHPNFLLSLAQNITIKTIVFHLFSIFCSIIIKHFYATSRNVSQTLHTFTAAFKMLSSFPLLQSHTFHCEMCLACCPQRRYLAEDNSLSLSLSPLLGYFISPLNSCDSSSSDRVWLVFTTSSANPDT